MRDLRLVRTATEQVVECAHREGFHSVSTMLLAAGGRRTFPRSYTLLQMVRGWAGVGGDDEAQRVGGRAQVVVGLEDRG